MHPTMRQVIPLTPEAIKNTDGTTKQDCEIQAAKRLVKRILRDHPKLRVIIVAGQLAQQTTIHRGTSPLGDEVHPGGQGRGSQDPHGVGE